jgi:hypothetical protein
LKGERVIALCITFVQVGLDNQTSCFWTTIFNQNQ